MHQEKLQSILETCTASITYSPLSTEIDYASFPMPARLRHGQIIPKSSKNTDPFQVAVDCIRELQNEKVCVFIPGTMFDANGTRHGRGEGWYDRFLSQVPKEWIRIGVTDTLRFSHQKLIREPWDESMDWILVYDTLTSSWDVFEALHQRV